LLPALFTGACSMTLLRRLGHAEDGYGAAVNSEGFMGRVGTAEIPMCKRCENKRTKDKHTTG